MNIEREFGKNIFNQQKTKDHELIEKTRTEWKNYPDQGEEVVALKMVQNPEYFSEKLKDKPLFDLGSQENFYSKVYTGNRHFKPHLLMSDYPNIPNGASEVILVDPFVKEVDEYLGEKDKKLNEGEEVIVDSYRIFSEKPDKDGMHSFKDIDTKQVKLDALSFLNKQKNNSGNVLTSNLDFNIISSDEYHKRLAEEIYRVVPKNGIYICQMSDAEKYAGELFSEYKKFGVVTVFEKN